MGCGSSNASQAEAARLELFPIPPMMCPQFKRENHLLVIPRKLEVSGTMASDAGADWDGSRSVSPKSECNGDFQKEPSLAVQLGFPEPPKYECSEAHVKGLEIFLAEIQAQPVRFVQLISEVRRPMDGCARGQEKKDDVDALSCASTHLSGHSGQNPSKTSGPSSEGLSCATTATSRTIDEKDLRSMDFGTDEQINKIRDLAQHGASKPRMLTHIRVTGNQAASAA
jgi:hypothetical protein